MGFMLPADKYIEINGLKYHYLDWGNHKLKPMLLLHGFMGHAHIWDDFASAIKTRYRVIALDQRGHGDSQWSKNASYTMDDHLSDIAGFVDSLDLRDLILIGHSMGGRNALLYTACVPQRVRSLVLVDARPDGNPKTSRTLKRLVTALPLRPKSLEEVVRAVRGLYPSISIKNCQHMAKYGYKQISNKDFTPKYDTSMAVLSEQFSYSAESLWPLTTNIHCPTLVLRGEKSKFLSRRDAQMMCDSVPTAVFGEIPNATHMLPDENPVAFKKIVLDFLDNLEVGVFNKKNIPKESSEH